MNRLTSLIILSLLFLASCSQQPPIKEDDLGQLPHLGESREMISSKLSSRVINYPSPLTFYKFTIAGQAIRLSLNYALLKNNKEILSVINIDSDNIDGDSENKYITEETKDAVLNAFLPDRHQIATQGLPPRVLADSQNLQQGENVMFISSKRASLKIPQAITWSINSQQWLKGECVVDPKIMEVYSRRDENGALDRMVLSSDYLYHCEQRAMDL